MLNIKQTTEVLRAGKEDCKHLFVKKNRGHISLFPLSHTQEHVCFHCRQHEVVTTKVVYENPFSFEAIMARED